MSDVQRRSVPVTSRMTPEIKYALDALAKENKMSLSDYLLTGRIKEINNYLIKHPYVEERSTRQD